MEDSPRRKLPAISSCGKFVSRCPEMYASMPLFSTQNINLKTLKIKEVP